MIRAVAAFLRDALDVGDLRRDLARLTGAAAAERLAHDEAIRRLDASWAARFTALERDLAAAQAECRELNGAHRVLVAERDHAIAELHAANVAIARAQKAAHDLAKKAKR